MEDQNRLVLYRNARLVRGGTVADILVEGERVHSVGANLVGPAAGVREEDLGGMLVLPGAIDCHVHFREPGASHKADWATESAAAAAGGVTSVLDMPNNEPPATRHEVMQEKRSIAGRASRVDHGFFMGYDGANIQAVVAEKNIPGVKVYMNTTTGGMELGDEKRLLPLFGYTGRVAVHAEGETLALALRLAKQAGRRDLYITHVPTRHELGVIEREKDLRVYVEATPHHLFLTGTDTARLGGFADMKPPLGAEADRQALWEALVSGRVDTVATDHAPHTREEKRQSPWPAGVPGIQFMLPLLLNEVNNGALTLSRLVEVLCENPAAVYGIRNKGAIAPGMDADLVVVDMHLEREITDDLVLSKCGWTPYAGRRLRGWPVRTLVRGREVFPEHEAGDAGGRELRFGD